ncbi:hypothetical protein D6R50_09445 [Aeromonas veronii]|uniref:Uncharacterized protein n=1 Tax=Aeromonas veronii TaxID=654 RepID=A0A3A9IFU8_AERVE|nr:hypothetical protein D6R50_13070 [Aeromonas veronii]RKJ89470.1 hypothetical protein D6R50_09445 [Aeromonas veronii]
MKRPEPYAGKLARTVLRGKWSSNALLLPYHHRRARSQDNRLDSAWFGQGAQLKTLALNRALTLLQ